MSDFERRNLPLFQIGVVMQLTELTARQIRYYEEQELIQPSRTKGRQRLFSFNDIEKLLEIKRLLEKKINIAGIKEIFTQREEEAREREYQLSQKEKPSNISDAQLRELVKRELLDLRPGKTHSLIQGEISRFFH